MRAPSSGNDPHPYPGFSALCGEGPLTSAASRRGYGSAMATYLAGANRIRTG